MAVARSNAAVNAGPRVCWENTAITLPSTGNTASRPLQRSPTVLASQVTAKVSKAPATIRSSSLSDFGAGPETIGCTAGNRYGAASSAVAAAIIESGSDGGSNDRITATRAQTSNEIVSASGHFARCATWA
ncbi:hypothetical protein D9M71_776370 [compost metagenome]